jgi:PBSX family phage portal protein
VSEQTKNVNTRSARPFGFVTKSGRFVRSDLLEQYACKAAGDSRQLVDAFSSVYNDLGLLQPLYNPEALAGLLELNTYHYRACKTKARDAAGLGWSLQPTVENPSETQKEQVENFFKNLSLPVSTIFDRAMLDYEAVGYGAIELVREDTRAAIPTNLVHMPAHTMRRHTDRKRACQIRGNKRSWFKLAGVEGDINFKTGDLKERGKVPAAYRGTEVLWFVNYTPKSDAYGLPDVMPALGAIHGDLSRRDYNIAFFDNYGVPAYAVFITGNYDPGEEDPETGQTDLETEIEAHFKELREHPNSILVLALPTRGKDSEIKVEFKPLSTEVKEASFRLYRADNRDEVLAAHGVPPYRCGIAETGSLGGSTAAESTEIYKMSVINPRQELLETLIDQHILRGGFGITDWRFRFAEIDTSDEAHDLTILTGMFGLGAVTPNQVIRHFGARFGLDEVEHWAMNAHYIAGQPLDVDGMTPGQAEQAVKQLQSKLVEVAIKHAGGDDPDNPRFRELLACIKGLR